MASRQLGRTDIRVSPIGLGGSQFSAGGISTFYVTLAQAEVDAIVKAALDGGVSWFDTAEGYGAGRSERSLAAGLRHAGMTPDEVTVSTKWTPLGRAASNLERTIGDRTGNLAPFRVDLHQIHTGYGSLSPIRAQMQAMARLADSGKIRSVGVSNFSARQLKIAHGELAKHGIPLASNQVQINLLHRKIETNGVLETARELGITLIAYVPLRSGMLTGKFHADRELAAGLPRLRRMMAGISPKSLDRTTPLIDGLREIAGTHQATVGQVALAWLITHYGDTVVATPGASRPRHAEEAAGAMKVALSEDETGLLAELSTRVTR